MSPFDVQGTQHGAEAASTNTDVPDSIATIHPSRMRIVHHHLPAHATQSRPPLHLRHRRCYSAYIFILPWKLRSTTEEPHRLSAASGTRIWPGADHGRCRLILPSINLEMQRPSRTVPCMKSASSRCITHNFNPVRASLRHCQRVNSTSVLVGAFTPATHTASPTTSLFAMQPTQHQPHLAPVSSPQPCEVFQGPLVGPQPYVLHPLVFSNPYAPWSLAIHWLTLESTLPYQDESVAMRGYCKDWPGLIELPHTLVIQSPLLGTRGHIA